MVFVFGINRFQLAGAPSPASLNDAMSDKGWRSDR